MSMLDTVKNAMWINVADTSQDSELARLIDAACADLGIVGVNADSSTSDANLTRAIVTFCRLNFGTPDDYDRLKKSYDEQKAQLITATGYGL